MTSKEEKYQEMMNLFRLYFIFSKRFYGQEGRFGKLTHPQGRTLMYIQEHPGKIQRELADEFHLRNASIANMLKNLERDGYIQRKQDKNSARIKRIYITESGKQQVTEIRKDLALKLKELSSRVDEELLDQLIPLLKELNQQVRND